MSRTFNTTPAQYKAAKVDLVDEIKIIERGHGRYDYHPLNKVMLQDLLKDLNPKYMLGLKTIELKQKRNSYLANRLGTYLFSKRKITLFSIELSPIFVGKFNQEWRTAITRFKGEIIENESTSRIVWKTQTHQALWYLNFVLCHEIAHHYIWMNRFRRKRISKKSVDEARANKWANRIYDEFIDGL